MFDVNLPLVGENRPLMPATYGTNGFAPSPLSSPIARLFHCKAAIAAADTPVRIARELRAAAGPEDLASPAAHRRPSSQPIRARSPRGASLPPLPESAPVRPTSSSRPHFPAR